MWTFPRTCYADCNGSEASEKTEIAVNIGGVKHVLYGDALNRYPETRLAELVNRSTNSSQEDLSALCDDYDESKREFYFDRDPEAFKCILELYHYGEIRIKRRICPIRFKTEMDYWGIDDEHLNELCKSHLNDAEIKLEEIVERAKAILKDLKEDVAVTRVQRCQAFIRKLMEKPESSLAARVISIMSITFILLSSVIMCVSTIPELQVQNAEGKLAENPIIDCIETTCIIWFTTKYVLRFFASRNKLRFLISFLNIIDFVTIMPFYIMLILGSAMMGLGSVQQAVQSLRVMRVSLRVMRLARIFKLARHSSGLRTLALALKSSLKELGMIFVYMGVGVFLFSSLGYSIEQNQPETMFTSIPLSFWWAISSMSTVGYGDMYPQTTLGKCNAAVSFLCGILAITLPLNLIINNFVSIYNKQHELENTAKREIKLMALQAEEEAQECQEAGKMQSETSVSNHSVRDSAYVTA